MLIALSFLHFYVTNPFISGYMCKNIEKKGGEDVLKVDDIYQEYATLVYKYIYSLCHDENLAEELTQETFYQAVKSQKSYNGTCKVSTWLCQIAKHLYYQEIDRRKRKGTSPLVETIVSAEQSPDEKVIQRDTMLELYKRVHILDEVSKEIFLLRVMGDLSFREIGNIFGKTENWARVTFYRAKQKVVKGWDD